MVDCSDKICQLKTAKLDNLSLQTQVYNLKMLLEDRFNNSQKDNLKKTFIEDLSKFKSHTDFSKFLNKTKSQLEQVFNDYLALKQFSLTKSDEIKQLKQQIEEQDQIIGVLKSHDITDPSLFIQQHHQQTQQIAQLNSALLKQQTANDKLSQQLIQLQQTNVQLEQYIQHSQSQLNNEVAIYRDERKKQIKEIIEIGEMDEDQKNGALRMYLQKNDSIVQEIEYDIEEEKRQEEMRQKELKKLRNSSKSKKNKYTKTNTRLKNSTTNRPASNHQTNKQNEPLRQTARLLQSGFNNNDQQMISFSEQAKQLNKQNSEINQEIIRSTVYNKKRSNSKNRSVSKNSSRYMNNSYSVIQTNKMSNTTNKKSELNGQNILGNSDFNYASQPLQQLERSESLVLNLQVIKQQISNIAKNVNNSTVNQMKATNSPAPLAYQLLKTVFWLLQNVKDSPYKVCRSYLNQIDFIDKLHCYDPDSLSEQQYKEINIMINLEGMSIQKIKDIAGICYMDLYRWLQEVYCYYRIKNRL